MATTKRAVLLFSAFGLLSLAGALLCLAATGLRLELKYVGVTVGFFLAMLSVAKVQELRRAMREAPVAPQAFVPSRKPQLMAAPAGFDDEEDAELAAKLAQLRARAHAVPAAEPPVIERASAPSVAEGMAPPLSSSLHQRGDELRADIARLREGSRARRAHPAAAEAAVSVAPPGFLEELSMPSPRASVPAPLTPQPLPAARPMQAAAPAPAPADDDYGDPFARTQISGLEVTHVQAMPQEEGEVFAKTEFTDFGHADHGQFASTEYLGPPGPRK